MILLLFYVIVCALLFVGMFGRYVGSRGVQLITVISVGFIASVSWWLFLYENVDLVSRILDLAPWVDAGVLFVGWSFLFDPLAVCMMVVVTTISFAVHMFSIDYMEKDPHKARFMFYLTLFTFAMMFLVAAKNFALMFLGWEGVGICSYLLISFWYTRKEATLSGVKAIVINRIADFSIGLVFILLFLVFGTLDYTIIFACVPYFYNTSITIFNYSFNQLELIGILLLLSTIAKSAQLGMHGWLFDAMEGPTPVSALIHAATMVTAGVFLLIRFSPLLEYCPKTLGCVAVYGAITSFFGSLVGVMQTDLKKVIASSTASQLGLMVMACGSSFYVGAIFHLFIHAFVKALLFLSAGSVIHAMSDEQDMRRMGGLAQVLPFTYMLMILGFLSLMGFPFFSGYYSKDGIVEVSALIYNTPALMAYFFAGFTSFFGGFYSFRVLSLVFHVYPNNSRIVYSSVHESPFFMLLSLSMLVIGAIFFGYIFQDMFLGVGNNYWGNSIYVLAGRIGVLENLETTSASFRLLSFTFSVFGSLMAVIFYYIKPSIFVDNRFLANIYYFIAKTWYIDNIFTFLGNRVLVFSYQGIFKGLDKGILEKVGPNGVVVGIQHFVSTLLKVQSGNLYHYIFILVISVSIGLLLFLNVVNLELKYLVILIFFVIFSRIFKK
jgi:proton-translocating NADH-quinone oxidoreductase chain L